MAAPYECICKPGYIYNSGAKRCLLPCATGLTLNTANW